jgi:hypothetical protein
VDLDWEPPRDAAVRLVPLWVAERYGLIAMDWDPTTERIVIACADPTSNDALSEVRRTTGLAPVACVATASQIDRAIRQHYYGEAEPAPTPHPHLQVTRTPVPGALRAKAEGEGGRAAAGRRSSAPVDPVGGS